MGRRNPLSATIGDVVTVIVEIDVDLTTLKALRLAEVVAGDMVENDLTVDVDHTVEIDLTAEVSLTVDQDPIPGTNTAARDEVVEGEATLDLAHTRAADQEIGAIGAVRKEAILQVILGPVVGAGIGTEVERRRGRRTRKEKKIKSEETDRTQRVEVAAEVKIKAKVDPNPQ